MGLNVFRCIKYKHKVEMKLQVKRKNAVISPDNNRVIARFFLMVKKGRNH